MSDQKTPGPSKWNQVRTTPDPKYTLSHGHLKNTNINMGNPLITVQIYCINCCFMLELSKEMDPRNSDYFQ